MARNKPIPRSQRLEFNRGTKVSRNSPAVKDDVKNVSVGLMDMDSSILFYFNNVIKPEVEENKEKVKVPCLYASPERWVSIQKNGFIRDKQNQVIVPLIAFKRTAMEKNQDIPIDKLDANKPRNFYSFQKKYSQVNRYDKFSIQQGLSPGREYYNVTMPDYVTLTYEFTIWTSYIEQMNKIIEKIMYSEGSYWGEPGKMRFRTQIESYTDASEMEAERLIKTTFTVNLFGYILPESYNNYTTTQKYLTPKKIIMRENADTTLVDETGRVSLADNSAVEGGAPTKDLFSISVTEGLTFTQGTGVTISNTGVSFDGSSALTQAISIGQPVGTTDSVTFSQVTASSALQIGDSSTKYTTTGISGSIDITGSLVTTGNLTVAGNATINGTLTANEFHTVMTSASILFESGSTKFGNSTDDKHEFTGSAQTTGSFKLNGYSVDEISNDTSLTDGSATALVTENAVKTYVEANTTTVSGYLRKQFVKVSSGVSNASTASFSSVASASAPTGYTATSENDFIFFINGQYMEHDALTIQQAGSNFLLKVNTSGIGYTLESDDEILAIGKFNS
jgi:hypothetical protein|tara:strand:+ start:185 stop:1876 length:1692 start_codon:yes stop_codon:yes gene_type:complete